jgi:hypothetical protein
MEPDSQFQHRFILRRSLPPGIYNYKFVIVSNDREGRCWCLQLLQLKPVQLPTNWCDSSCCLAWMLPLQCAHCHPRLL